MFTKIVNTILVYASMAIGLFNLSAQSYLDYSSVIFKLKNNSARPYLKTIETNSIKIIPFYQHGTKSLQEIDLIFVATSFKSIESSFIDKLMSSGYVEWAHYKQIPEILYTPNDPLLTSQYYLSLMDAFSAWDITLGNSEMAVGIVDTGTDPTHPDLVNQFAYNVADPLNGIDDDFDGFVDNYLGWNLASNNNNVTAIENPHGIGISGIVAAQANNAFGISGVSPGVKIMPIKVIDEQGSLTAAYEGILYAAQKGCKVIVCSWGGIIPDKLSETIINYVLQNYSVIIVAAAGNSKDEKLYYPASYPGVVSVLATNNYDHKWVGSTYGYRIDLAAPGQNILSTAAMGGFSVTSGSSNAAPMVAGLAALIKSVRPHLSAEQVVAQMKVTALYLDTFPANIPFANKLGAGRINIFRALTDSSVFYPRVPERIIQHDFVSPSQTVNISTSITNILSTKNNIFVAISPLSDYVSIINGTFLIPYWPSQQTIDFSQFNIKLTFSPLLPMDLKIPIRFSFFAGTQTNHIIRIIHSQNSWYDLNAFPMKLTLSSTGKPGFHTLSPQVGYGLRKGNSGNFLWDAGMVAGTSAEKIITTISGINDFQALQPATPTISSTWGTAIARFTESNPSNGIGCEYTVEIETGALYPLSEAILYKVTVINKSALTVSGLRVGLFTSWLVSRGGTISFNPSLNLVTIQSVENYPYVHGVALLTRQSGLLNYSFDTGTNPSGINITDDFTRDEMWQALNQHNDLEAPLGKSIPAHLLSSGNYSIAPGDSITLNFAFLTDNHQTLIESHLTQLRNYLELSTTNYPSDYIKLPNPVKEILPLPNETKLLEIYTIDGRLVKSSNNSNPVGLADLPEGVYLVKIEWKNRIAVKKIVIWR